MVKSRAVECAGFHLQYRANRVYMCELVESGETIQLVDAWFVLAAPEVYEKGLKKAKLCFVAHLLSRRRDIIVLVRISAIVIRKMFLDMSLKFID